MDVVRQKEGEYKLWEDIEDQFVDYVEERE